MQIMGEGVWEGRGSIQELSVFPAQFFLKPKLAALKIAYGFKNV